MAKRPAEDTGHETNALKSGERPLHVDDNEDEEFEDEFEDEYESEDEILEAGVDGRPDEEREAEERRGMWITPKAVCERLPLDFPQNTNGGQMLWTWTSRHSFQDVIN